MANIYHLGTRRLCICTKLLRVDHIGRSGHKECTEGIGVESPIGLKQQKVGLDAQYARPIKVSLLLQFEATRLYANFSKRIQKFLVIL